MEYTYFRPGQIIRSPRSGDMYKIIKVNPKNYRCVDPHGGTWNVDRRGVVLLDKSEWLGDPEPEKPLGLGTAVRFKTQGHKTNGIFVIADWKSTGYRLVRLGGSDGMRYFHSIQASSLEPVDEINDRDWSLV